MNPLNKTYFAADEAKKTAGTLLNKSNNWYNELNTNGYLQKLRMMWASYHGAYFSDFNNSHGITFGGEQGELANISVNHIRNLAQHIIVMITSNRPSLQARATNSDHKSLVQARLANGLLDYYLREKRLEEYLKVAVEYAIVLGSGYIKMEWNATSGDVYDFNEETQTEIREGDVEFYNLSPFDVVVDSSREDQKHDWVVCRTFKNRYDIIAKYPEYSEQILGLPSKADLQVYYLESSFFNQTELIPVYEFYHRRSEALPDGRYLLFLSGDVVLLDSPMPYRDLPVYRIAPANILGAPYGYTPLFDILPIQDSINALYSTILTNQNAFGVQNVLVPRGADVSISELAGGLNIIEANMQYGPIAPLNLTQTPAEVFKFLEMLEKVAETISGVSSVTRGNPETSLKSGNALALVQSMSLQFMSGLQQSYIMMIENVGTGLINMLKDFANVPRVAMISGVRNKTAMKEFTGDDLSSVNRVIVDVGNPLSRCLAKDTPILMYDGTIKVVQDIQAGEQIMGPDSGPRTIESTATGTEMMYEVTSKDINRNIKYGCNESHILTLKYCSDDYRYDAQKGDILDISIKDYLKLTDRQKRLLQGFTAGVDFEKKNLPIPAYILGAWLGDGHSAVPALTSMDKELVDEWTNYAKSINMQVRVQENRQPNKSKVYFITSGQSSGSPDRNPFMNELRELELINNKHIPSIYLINSREERLNLLAGLLDTDGHRIDETFIFTQKNERLVKDVEFLAKSLGFRVTTKKFKSNSSKLVGELNSECFKISIGGNTNEIPTKLPRKQCKSKEKARDPLNYGINIECKGIGTYYGFTLEEEPHFLLGDFTVTHNTTAGRVEMAEQLLQMGVVKSPEQYFQVLNTGQLDVMTDNEQNELDLIRDENEKLVEGKEIIAIATDEHSLHIREHRSVLADPELRLDPELLKRTLDHIQEHLNLERTTDPDLLRIIKEQPLSPPGGSPANPGQQQPPGNAMQGAAPQMMQPPPQGADQISNVPQPAAPPPPFQSMPTNPANMLPQ